MGSAVLEIVDFIGKGVPLKINLISYSFGQLQSGSFGHGGGGGTGKVESKDFSVTRTGDEHSNKLLQICAEGKHIAKIKLVVTYTNEDRITAKYTNTFDDSIITSMQMGQSSVEYISFNYASSTSSYG